MMDTPSSECHSSGESSAATLYRDGMYRQAASEFHNISRKRPHADRSDSSKTRLRALASEADALLCVVRSLTNVDLEYPLRCDYALKSNRRYREALFGTLQEFITDQSTSDMRRRIIAVVESLLLALVSAVWLYVQTQKVVLARDIVLEDMRRLLPILSGCRDSGEGSLLPPRKEMLREIEKVVSSHSVAWRQLGHALRVLDFMVTNGEEDQAPSPPCTASPKPDNDEDAVDASLSQLGVRELLLEALRLDQRLQNDPQCPPVFTRRSRDQFLGRAVSIERSAAVAGENIAVRIKTLIHAVERARAADVSNTDSSSRELATTLEAHLGGNTSSATSWNLLGCLKASYDVDGALQSFHKSHELDPTRPGRNPSQSTTRLFCRDRITSECLLSFIVSTFCTTETVFNMAKCFLAFGDTARAQDLLVFLRQAAQPDPKQSTRLTAYRLSTPTSYTASNDLLTISWACYLVATLEGNVTVQLEAIDSLRDKGFKSTWVTLALGFSYLRAGTFRRAYKSLQTSKKKELGSRLENAALELYEAEAAVKGLGDTSLVPPSLLGAPGELQLGARSTTEMLLGSTKDFGLFGDEISAVLWNGRGLSCLAHGRPHDALMCFRDACQSMKRLSSVPHCRKSVCMQPFYNLALLLWVEKRVAEACEVWMSARGSPWTSLNTQQLTLALKKSVEEYREYLPLSPEDFLVWQPPTGVAREDILLLDIIMLQSALHLGNDGKLVALLQGPGF
jgi:hypothetical protein